MGFNNQDLAQIKLKGINPEEVSQQLSIFKRGNLQVNLLEAATLKNGINAFSEEEEEDFIGFYEKRLGSVEVLKFVPASGAATRMFKALYSFLEEYKSGAEPLENFLERKNDPKLELFFNRLQDLPFYEEVIHKIKENHKDIEELPNEELQRLFVEVMLQEEGLNLANYPKGLVPFHKYPDHLATAFEEQLMEAAYYAASNGKVKVHFTVAVEHLQKFQEEFVRLKPRLLKETGMEYEVSYSSQDPKTDTIAVDENNKPFRTENGELFFRPGGHGSLIENLNNQEADIVFIKNIDNVVIPKFRETLARHKKILAGLLLKYQETTFGYLRKLGSENIGDEDLAEMIQFLQKDLKCGMSVHFEDLETSEKVLVLKEKLNRPMRICGMVKNEGEPGGGPFWVTDKAGEISLQIIESSQIDHDNYQQSKIAQEATHFNPVDVVCGIKDFQGKKFDLHKYIDKDTSFISNKTLNGRELKALEHPGLWNGAMANWITLFVEVPVETFNPVKTVADLLRPTHQIR